ncbi:metal ABC transporter solute-binding protein, Zn/Mn family, partial [Lysinibacillus sp. D4A3_S15]|uniref:metal ABC transporter solute-binding protein, Zn/Mn family n=1 Tax=Lysinibacillus sp. D4A3_S15 TaxID=2941227 RepID=UPI0037CA33A3
GQMHDIFEQMAKHKTVLAVGETLDTKELLASDSDAMRHDPHIWFDIELWKGVVQAISLQLQEEYPEFKEDFQQNEMS